MGESVLEVFLYLVVVLVVGVGPGLQVSTVPHDDGNDEELS